MVKRLCDAPDMELPSEMFERVAESVRNEDHKDVLSLRATCVNAWFGCDRVHRRYTASRKIQRWWRFRNFDSRKMVYYNDNQMPRQSLWEMALMSHPSNPDKPMISSLSEWWDLQQDFRELYRRRQVYRSAVVFEPEISPIKPQRAPFNVLQGVLVCGKNVRCVHFHVFDDIDYRNKQRVGISIGPGFRCAKGVLLDCPWVLMLACKPIFMKRYERGRVLRLSFNSDANVRYAVPLWTNCPNDIPPNFHTCI